MLKMAETHRAAAKHCQDLRTRERDQWAAERLQMLEEHDKNLQDAAEAHDVEISRIRGEVRRAARGAFLEKP